MRHKSPVHGEGNVRVKGADRTSVLGEAKTVQPFAVVGIIYPPFSLVLYLSPTYAAADVHRVLLLFVIYER